MPPKKATPAASQKKAAAAPAHASYKGQCLIPIHPPNVVALTWVLFYHGREPLLTRLCRYDQGGYPHCESTKSRAIVDVARRQLRLRIMRPAMSNPLQRLCTL